MSLHTWFDHVVHVELVSGDSDISGTTSLFLQRHFHAREVEVSGETGHLEVRSDPDATVSAAEIAQALLEAGVRAHRVHERLEWSVAEVSTT